MDTWKPTGVSFSGGGARTIGHLGVLSHLLSCGMLSQVRNWYGCSGGSFMAVLGAIGGSATWIHDIVDHLDMSVFAGIDDEMLIDFQNSFGINSGNKLVGILSKFIDTWEPGCSKWTFADLLKNRPGAALHITVTNLTRGRHEVFNHITTPNVLIVEAMRASCAIPFYFTPWRSANGDLFCDGGLIETYPWNHVDDKNNTLVVICADIDVCGRPERRPITSFGDFMGALNNIIAKNKTIEAPRHWIAVNNNSVGFVDFHISAEIRRTLYEEGKAAATAWNAFRKKAVEQGRLESPPRCADPHTLSSDPPSPDKTSDSRQSRNPLPPPCPIRDSRSGTARRGRRWSL
jgi:predicted acylesterase/phospholipase RssA